MRFRAYWVCFTFYAMLNFFIFNILYKNVYVLITSSDLSRLYCIGFIVSLFFGIQIFSGVLLSFIYSNYFNMCWFSVLSITDFEAGYLIRGFHITGTSFIYLTLYIHIFKVFFQMILNNSAYVVWVFGFILYFLSVIIAFIGYVLPLTQMSYWGLTVFSNILSTVPFLGKLLCYWVWGSEFIQDFTLIKVHSLHVFLPFILILFIVAHLFFLHFFLSSDGFYDRYSFYWEKTMFFYYFFYRDLSLFLFIVVGHFYFCIIYWYFVFHEESFIIVDTMKTSDKIIPEWFFLTFFGFIKAIPDKFGGICILVTFLIIFFNCLFTIVYFNCTGVNGLILLNSVYLLLILLNFIGILSTNVTIVYPFCEQLQILVFFAILIIGFKIL